MTEVEFIRPRIVLLTTPLSDADAPAAMRAALAAGDVASVLIDPAGREGDAFQAFAESMVPLIQEAGAAAIVVDDTRCAGRVKADGLHLTTGRIEDLKDAIEGFAPKLIVGASGFETRHDALEAGERMPDYLFFGRLGGDIADAPHKKNLAMGEWWAEIVEIPCIVMAGADIESVAAAAETRSEFIAISTAVFAAPDDAGAKVARANAILDELKASVVA